MAQIHNLNFEYQKWLAAYEELKDIASKVADVLSEYGKSTFYPNDDVNPFIPFKFIMKPADAFCIEKETTEGVEGYDFRYNVFRNNNDEEEYFDFTYVFIPKEYVERGAKGIHDWAQLQVKEAMQRYHEDLQRAANTREQDEINKFLELYPKYKHLIPKE